MTTGEAIISFCKECVNSNMTKDRENCGGEYVLATKKPCHLFKYRVGGRAKISAIRKNCIECSGSIYQVEECTTKTCPLYDFRMGKIPNRQNKAGVIPEHLKKWQFMAQRNP
jgi:predicted  nucleic acid-binding Zn ribbon protein